jgi:hypothetical protein
VNEDDNDDGDKYPEDDDDDNNDSNHTNNKNNNNNNNNDDDDDDDDDVEEDDDDSNDDVTSQQSITSEELNDMTVKELKSLCKESGFRGYRKMRKEALVGTLCIQKLICININLSVCMWIYIFIDRAAAIRW